MAKAAQATKGKMGRPKSSKNKSSSDKGLVAQFSQLAFDAQERLLSELSSLYDSAKKSRAAELMAELSKLGISTGAKRGRPAKAANGGGHVGTGRRKHPLAGVKAKPKYRSKKDPSLTWAGRGLAPKWMAEEMKGTKLKKDDFLIA